MTRRINIGLVVLCVLYVLAMVAGSAYYNHDKIMQYREQDNEVS